MLRSKAWVGLVVLGCCARPMPRPADSAPKPVRPKPPPPIRVPAGCEASLAGQWQHEEDPTFRYHFADDLREATVWVYRVFPERAPDAGSATATVAARRPDRGADSLDAGTASWLSADSGAAAPGDAGAVAGSPDAGAADAGAHPASHRHPVPLDLLPIDGGAPPLAAAVIHLRRTPDGFVGETEQLHLLASGTECRATFATRVIACGPASLTLASAGSTPVGEGCQTPSLPQPAAMLEHRLARMDAGAL